MTETLVKSEKLKYECKTSNNKAEKYLESEQYIALEAQKSEDS